mmetsp:Transcript_27127/g.64857  ORF Transcript_27127/g.64857 Transcript_27127/m.64857 type:complete len:155 (-) Transcript_27127:780-1244(-)
MNRSILLELVQAVFPCRCMTIPDESNVLQQPDTFRCHCALLVFHHEFVLVPLPFDPASQPDVLFICMRDLTVRNNVRRKRSNAIGQTLILILENEKQVGMIRFSRKTKMEQEEENDLPVAMRSFEVDKIVKLLRPLFALITSEALIILIILRWI